MLVERCVGVKYMHAVGVVRYACVLFSRGEGALSG